MHSRDLDSLQRPQEPHFEYTAKLLADDARVMPPLSHLLLNFLELRPHAVASGFPFDLELSAAARFFARAALSHGDDFGDLARKPLGRRVSGQRISARAETDCGISV
jgi:hypothetical protein